MPYHDLSLVRGLVVKQLRELEREVTNLFKRQESSLHLPPSEPDHNAPPPNHWMGFWICSSCRAYVYPAYRHSSHPYDHLRCLNPNCDAVISPRATTSLALSRISIPTPVEAFVPVERLTGAHRAQIPYFTVCLCGLTHRARLYKQSLYKKWKHFPSIRRDESALYKFRRFVKHKDEAEVTLIEFEHIQCNKCYRKYDAHRWQHFVINRDAVFHIDGHDEHGRWTEVRHE